MVMYTCVVNHPCPTFVIFEEITTTGNSIVSVNAEKVVGSFFICLIFQVYGSIINSWDFYTCCDVN